MIMAGRSQKPLYEKSHVAQFGQEIHPEEIVARSRTAVVVAFAASQPQSTRRRRFYFKDNIDAVLRGHQSAGRSRFENIIVRGSRHQSAGRRRIENIIVRGSQGGCSCYHGCHRGRATVQLVLRSHALLLSIAELHPTANVGRVGWCYDCRVYNKNRSVLALRTASKQNNKPTVQHFNTIGTSCRDTHSYNSPPDRNRANRDRYRAPRAECNNRRPLAASARACRRPCHQRQQHRNPP